MPILGAYIVPHPPMAITEIGGGSEIQIINSVVGCTRVAKEIKEIAPDTIIFISPHSPMYHDRFYVAKGETAKGSFARFNAPQVRFNEKMDSELAGRIIEEAEALNIPTDHDGVNDDLDHGIMVPLRFIKLQYQDAKIVRIGISGLSFEDHFKLGKAICKAIDSLDRRVVIVASGDLSHKLQEYGPYGFAKEGVEYDKRLIDVISKNELSKLMEFDADFLDKAAICGHNGFIMLSGILDGLGFEPAFVSYDDITGVGYGVFLFHRPEKS